MVRGAVVISEKQRKLQCIKPQIGKRGGQIVRRNPLVKWKKRSCFVSFRKKKSRERKSIIMNIDRNAILLVTDIREVLGEGILQKSKKITEKLRRYCIQLDTKSGESDSLNKTSCFYVNFKYKEILYVFFANSLYFFMGLCYKIRLGYFINRFSGIFL